MDRHAASTHCTWICPCDLCAQRRDLDQVQNDDVDMDSSVNLDDYPESFASNLSFPPPSLSMSTGVTSDCSWPSEAHQSFNEQISCRLADHESVTTWSASAGMQTRIYGTEDNYICPQLSPLDPTSPDAWHVPGHRYWKDSSQIAGGDAFVQKTNEHTPCSPFQVLPEQHVTNGFDNVFNDLQVTTPDLEQDVSWLVNWATRYPNKYPNMEKLKSLKSLSGLSEADIVAWLREHFDNQTNSKVDPMVTDTGQTPRSQRAPRYQPKCLKSRRRFRHVPETPKTTKIFECTRRCGESFKKKGDWKRHELYNIEEWKCHICNFAPSRKDKLPKHLQECNGYYGPLKKSHCRQLLRPSARPCGFCGMQFHDWSTWLNHVAAHFEGHIPGGPWTMARWSRDIAQDFGWGENDDDSDDDDDDGDNDDDKDNRDNNEDEGGHDSSDNGAKWPDDQSTKGKGASSGGGSKGSSRASRSSKSQTTSSHTSRSNTAGIETSVTEMSNLVSNATQTADLGGKPSLKLFASNVDHSDDHRQMLLSDGAIFHFSSFPPTENKVALSIRHLSRLSPTCSLPSLMSLMFEEDLVTNLFMDFDKALQVAAGGGHLHEVERLLAAKADVKAAAAYGGRAALQAAALGGHLDVLKMLLAAEADVKAAAAYGCRTALQAAALGGHRDVVKMLLAASADARGKQLNGLRWGFDHTVGIGHSCRTSEAPIHNPLPKKNYNTTHPVPSPSMTQRWQQTDQTRHARRYYLEKGSDMLRPISIHVPESPGLPIRLLHPSFRDFLIDEQRCCGQDFWVDEKTAHEALAQNCLKLMDACLRRDICDLHAQGALTSEVDRSRIEECLPPEVQYACLYWVQHLQKSGAQHYDNRRSPEMETSGPIDFRGTHSERKEPNPNYKERNDVMPIFKRRKVFHTRREAVAPNCDFGLRLSDAPRIDGDDSIGPDRELEQLQTWLTPRPKRQNVVALCGQGGMGKAQLSIQFARKFVDTYSSVFSLNGKDENTLKAGLAALAAPAVENYTPPSVNDAQEQERMAQHARQWLSRPRWLVVYDNYDGPRLPGMDSSTRFLHENAGENKSIKKPNSHRSEMHHQIRRQPDRDIYHYVRRMVVVRETCGYCWCIPINTYYNNNKEVLRLGINDHGPDVREPPALNTLEMTMDEIYEASHPRHHPYSLNYTSFPRVRTSLESERTSTSAQADEQDGERRERLRGIGRSYLPRHRNSVVPSRQASANLASRAASRTRITASPFRLSQSEDTATDDDLPPLISTHDLTPTAGGSQTQPLPYNIPLSDPWHVIENALESARASDGRQTPAGLISLARLECVLATERRLSVSAISRNMNPHSESAVISAQISSQTSALPTTIRPIDPDVRRYMDERQAHIVVYQSEQAFSTTLGKKKFKGNENESVDDLSKFTAVALDYSKMLVVVMNQSPERAGLGGGAIWLLLVALTNYSKLMHAVEHYSIQFGREFGITNLLMNSHPTKKMVETISEAYVCFSKFLAKVVEYYKESKLKAVEAFAFSWETRFQALVADIEAAFKRIREIAAMVQQITGLRQGQPVNGIQQTAEMVGQRGPCLPCHCDKRNCAPHSQSMDNAGCLHHRKCFQDGRNWELSHQTFGWALKMTVLNHILCHPFIVNYAGLEGRAQLVGTYVLCRQHKYGAAKASINAPVGVGFRNCHQFPLSSHDGYQNLGTANRGSSGFADMRHLLESKVSSHVDHEFTACSLQTACASTGRGDLYAASSDGGAFRKGISNAIYATQGNHRRHTSGSDDRTVWLWDTATGEARGTLKGHLDWVNAVVFSSDGRLVASGFDDRTVRLWDASTGQENTKFMQGQQPKFLPPWKPTKEDNEAINKLAVQMAEKTPQADITKIRANLDNMTMQQREIMNQKGLDSLRHFFRTQAAKEYRLQKMNVMATGSIADGTNGNQNTGEARGTLKANSDWVNAMLFCDVGCGTVGLTSYTVSCKWPHEDKSSCSNTEAEGNTSKYCSAALQPRRASFDTIRKLYAVKDRADLARFKMERFLNEADEDCYWEIFSESSMESDTLKDNLWVFDNLNMEVSAPDSRLPSDDSSYKAAGVASSLMPGVSRGGQKRTDVRDARRISQSSRSPEEKPNDWPI